MTSDRPVTARWLLTLLLWAPAAPARAQPFVYDFNGQSDAGLVHYDPLAAFGAPGSYTFPQLGPGDFGYRLQAAASPNPAALGPGRAGSARTDRTFTDVRAAVDLITWNNSLDQSFGPVARVSNLTIGQANGYGFLYFPRPGSAGGFVNFNRFDSEVPTPITANMPITLTPGHGYRMVFTAIGPLLSGQVFDLPDLTTPLVTATVTDATYGSGFTGLLAATALANPTGTADATFDNLSVAPVPEPGSLALTGLAACGLWARWRRRRRVR